MLRFYDIDNQYIMYLKKYEAKVPNIVYNNRNQKFMCGIVMSINDFDYFAPISSKVAKSQTSLLIRDENLNIISSIKFAYMIPAPMSVLTIKDFSKIAQNDKAYADLLRKEYMFCRNNEDKIRKKAEHVYKIGCNKNHVLNHLCCDFKLLEETSGKWLTIASSLSTV